MWAVRRIVYARAYRRYGYHHECTYSVKESGSRVNCAVLTKRISDGDRERDCPYFYPMILT
ncbi:hypothetical protein HQ586_10595 [Candidatus Bathyarchaeota archaeon]|nr:hypothetical protein [Candidatus Bathyarchaeota archaeon]